MTKRKKNLNLDELESILSNSEKELHSYVITHLEEIQAMTIRNLAENTFTNTGTIMRYCKKLGYSGFEEFKFHFHTDVKDLNYDDFLVTKSENSIHIINKMMHLYEDVVDKTNQLLSVTQLDRIIEKIENVKSIDFIVYDANIALAEYASHYFFLIGKVCNVYSDIDKQIQYASIADPKEHLVIIISRSGSTERLMKIAKILHRRKFHTVLMTQRYTTQISIYCTECIAALYDNHFDKMGDCIFYTSVKYLIDCIVNVYYTKNYKQILQTVEQYNDHFFETREKK